MKEFTVPSLLDYFKPPEEYWGCFGWMCGYSADAAFLDAAAGRFTGRSTVNRSREGSIALALLLDPGCSQILPNEAPAVAHLAIGTEKPPFRLMHAKVALLLFCHSSNREQWRLRLVVSTGNWTHETLESSLDLVWSIEVDQAHLVQTNEKTRQKCADMKSAWQMFEWLQRHYATDILDAGSVDASITVASRSPRKSFDYCVGKVAQEARKITPRFFDNRFASLQDQLPALIRQTAPTQRRAYLAMGSGFYEGGDHAGKVPPVLLGIANLLKDENLLCADAAIEIFVNRAACQAVADAHHAITEVGWVVREPGQPSFLGDAPRSLHAKFLFSTTHPKNAGACAHAWIYLGSGNLTGPGFTRKASASGGNLEAGVVFAPKDLRWRKGKGVPSRPIVFSLLPIQRDTELDPQDNEDRLAAGPGMPERSLEYLAPPVAYLMWKDATKNGWLIPPEGSTTAFDVLQDKKICVQNKAGHYLWSGDQPRQVIVAWKAEERRHQCVLPVIDQFGRIAGTMLPKLGFEDVWGQLIDFPLPPADEDDDQDEENNKAGKRKKKPDALDKRKHIKGIYPVRQMMELIENIAAKQTALPHSEWRYWCTKLEQSLIQVAHSEVVIDFRKRGVNPLMPLWHAPFRPAFAIDSAQKETALYEAMLMRVAKAWGVEQCAGLGDRP